MVYEIGTEQSIRKFESEELDRFIFDLKYELQSDELFNKIKYVVIQSGTSLLGNTQTGEYDKIVCNECERLFRFFPTKCVNF